MAHMQPHHKSILSLHANRVMNTLNRMQDLIRLCIALGSVRFGSVYSGRFNLLQQDIIYASKTRHATEVPACRRGGYCATPWN
jgi:hypothetical protein